MANFSSLGTAIAEYAVSEGDAPFTLDSFERERRILTALDDSNLMARESCGPSAMGHNSYRIKERKLSTGPNPT